MDTQRTQVFSAVGVLIYALWPSNRKRFDRAKRAILEDDDRPEE